MIVNCDYDVFVSLNVFVVIFNYVYVYDYCVVWGEIGDCFVGECVFDFFLFKFCDQIYY